MGSKVYSWGEYACKGVSLDSREIEEEVNSKTNIVTVCAGAAHFAAISADGKIYVWGNNEAGQLGIAAGFEEKFKSIPTLVTDRHVTESNLTALAMGDHHTVCLTESGVVTWGKAAMCGREIRTSVQESGIRSTQDMQQLRPALLVFTHTVVQLACGNVHTALVTDLGHVYTFGIGNFNQLGHGDKSNRVVPTLVSSLARNTEFFISKVACGGHHTLAITREGSVYGWGMSTYGQLGIEKTHTGLSVGEPIKIGFPDGVGVISAAAGDSHSLFLSAQGEVYATGYNMYGQCGQGHKNDVKTPHTVKFAKSHSDVVVPVSSVSCGPFHSAAVSDRGKLWVWGQGVNGQLPGVKVDQTSPTVVDAIDMPVYSVACGDSCTLAVAGTPPNVSKSSFTKEVAASFSSPAAYVYASDVASMRQLTEFHDLELRSGDRFGATVNAHKVIVFNRCPALFDACFHSPYISSVVVEKINTKELLDLFVKFLYDDFVTVTPGSQVAIELGAAAKQYHLEKLVKLCSPDGDDDKLDSSLSRDMMQALHSSTGGGGFSDLVFEFPTATIHAHKVVLAGRCKYFRELFRSHSESSRIDIIQYSSIPLVLISFLNFVYTNEVIWGDTDYDDMFLEDLFKVIEQYGGTKMLQQVQEEKKKLLISSKI